MPASPSGLTLHLRTTLPAARERAVGAHLDPRLLARWWGPHGFTIPAVELDPRPGGRYRITMQPPEGLAFHLSGEFREVAPPARLSYTFRWEEPHPDDRTTLVTLSYDDLGAATGLALEQGPFATEARRALHEQGWTETLERLAALLAEG